MPRRRPIPSDESKEQKFRRLAAYRANLILTDLRKLGNLANTGNYSYSQDDVNKLFNALEHALADTRALFKIRQHRGFNF
jgi:hypothetical protein